MRVIIEEAYRQRLHERLEEVFDSGFLSDGPMTRRFEEAFGTFTGLGAKAVSNGGAGLWALLEYAGVRGGEVIVPANTFWATALAARRAGATPVYADCCRDDLCLDLEDVRRKVTPATRAVVLVHIGGHIAFRAEEIASFCRERGIALIEDCAHVHGGTWNGKTGGHYGIGGSYSFYATKTMPLGEGGMVVSADPAVLEFVERFRNYGKQVVDGVVTYPMKDAFNFRMSEMQAALGMVQLERMPRILAWKRELAARYDAIFENRVRFPEGMESGYYKYIVFDAPALREATGKVFARTDLGPVIEDKDWNLPGTAWVVEHHQCPPIWYGWDGFDLDVPGLRARLLG
ncbi:DegT/DnrJ/EryC1/StrS family aminotransferase [Nitratidesulfovibrio vulgaris]|uniref:Aminotransferase, DegT/DnrJ/EryC1/StrS family n=1 Tax=Nitratidesulfovibrio vulgaris (strain ATCC 29579 / DSM 644 / CCUG 34227 / NCIMB 8303 / VKM B-1760 / Hildenborough) TaxID=882 RepID=Q726V1_NITV2|nr:DegT/DnrJ/EryC1/StrS family aminotransferase [Nitratidesulfovibrio vulgaris]AAS97476.1 aminotransferase, DegT/DnrJ/EryC1/StrS family [Nitratidesulfovibrio vulgaris str. Hildenborough]ADP87919.1 DegT/DnrJ/EryC1/StrS aminotransferase [Nitratidesulfovibrio vulgaris RCH1]